MIKKTLKDKKKSENRDEDFIKGMVEEHYKKIDDRNRERMQKDTIERRERVNYLISILLLFRKKRNEKVNKNIKFKQKLDNFKSQ